MAEPIARRTMLTGVLATASLAPALSGVGARSVAPFYKVVYSSRPETRPFADEARRLGHGVEDVGEDATALWYHDLSPRWRRGPAAIAGLTSPAAAFCLQILAQDAGLRLVFRGDHSDGPGGARHEVWGSEPMLSQADALVAGEWAAGAAQLLAAYRPGSTATGRRTLSGPRGGLGHQALVSWVMTPARA